MKVYAILPAGGTGERFGLSVPKQFQMVLGRPAICYALESFEKFDCVAKIIVTVASEYLHTLEAIKSKFCNTLKVTVIRGGRTRHRSIKNGVDHIISAGDHPDVVVIHDAVRPFTTESDVVNVLEAAHKYGAAGLVRPLVSTVVAMDSDGFLSSSLDRSAYRASEMPQAFRFEPLCAAYNQCTDFDLEYGTECLHLVSKYAETKVKLLEGGENLWKVTYRKDIHAMSGVLSESLMQSWMFVLTGEPSIWFADVVTALRKSMNAVITRSCKVTVCDRTAVSQQDDRDEFHNFVFYHEDVNPDLVKSDFALCSQYLTRRRRSGPTVGSCLILVKPKDGMPECELFPPLHDQLVRVLLGLATCRDRSRRRRQLHGTDASAGAAAAAASAQPAADPIASGILLGKEATADDAASFIQAIARIREPALSFQVYCLPSASEIGPDG